MTSADGAIPRGGGHRIAKDIIASVDELQPVAAAMPHAPVAITVSTAGLRHGGEGSGRLSGFSAAGALPAAEDLAARHAKAD